MNNLKLDQKIIETLGIIKTNNTTVKKLTCEKNLDNILRSVSDDKGMNYEELSAAYDDAQKRIKGINSEIKSYKDSNTYLQESIGNEIISEYQHNGTDLTNFSVTKEFPKIATVTIKAKQDLEMVENEAILNEIMKKIIDDGRLDLLSINKEAYIAQSKEVKKRTGNHLKGVYEMRPKLNVKINFKR